MSHASPRNSTARQSRCRLCPRCVFSKSRSIGRLSFCSSDSLRTSHTDARVKPFTDSTSSRIFGACAASPAQIAGQPESRGTRAKSRDERISRCGMRRQISIPCQVLPASYSIVSLQQPLLESLSPLHYVFLEELSATPLLTRGPHYCLQGPTLEASAPSEDHVREGAHEMCSILSCNHSRLIWRPLLEHWGQCTRMP